jgi:phosphoglucosamine mutase
MARLFGTSGIRGVFGKEIEPEMIIGIGRSMATFLGGGEVVVARDPRTSGELMARALMAGLMSVSCRAVDGGVAPTPALALSVRLLGKDAGAMITASHNPPEYNGVKFWDERGMAYTPEKEREIERLYFGREWREAEWKTVGGVSREDVNRAYIREIERRFEIGRRFRVVVDCGNGAGAAVTPVLLRRLGCDVIGINCQMDGRFPGRGLEPNEENLSDLGRIVREVGADLGVAHDGDADRVAVVDDRGRFVSGDRLVALLAGWIAGSGRRIVTTVDASMVVDEVAGRTGAEVVRTRVGDVSVACEVERAGAVFGGEPSGAMIFPDVHLAPDGPLGAVKVLKMLEEIGRPMSELVDGLPSYAVVRRKVACPREAMEAVMRAVTDRLPGLLRASSVLEIDGIRVETDRGWVLVRPSGTEPYIRVTAEGRDSRTATDLVEGVVELVEGARDGLL